MRKNGVPRRVRGDRAKEISKCLTQILRHAAPRLQITVHEDGFVDMGALLRAPRLWRQWVTEAEIIDVIHHVSSARLAGPLHQPRKRRLDLDQALSGGYAGVRGPRHVL